MCYNILSMLKWGQNDWGQDDFTIQVIFRN
jgi:hypothetical protein